MSFPCRTGFPQGGPDLEASPRRGEEVGVIIQTAKISRKIRNDMERLKQLQRLGILDELATAEDLERIARIATRQSITWKNHKRRKV